ncbi:hypothetical protein FHS39_002193 [Streptomyces olivoverticillatus]|uniref:Uncharacterized protein n=1 Tax=Streptomyces olivoverticillatus TaxID=66427 RepID=A0A7W7PKF1_9ACTN|nr:hypothetical protein [Streptomyces olivoverticillatus]MBB4893162.1 hypothetical protein [Streptomyces olivoverticillatus]
MTSQHTHLTPDLPPIVEIPDLPGAQHSGVDGAEREAVPSSGHVGGAHQEVDGRHDRAGEGSGG